MGKIIAIANQKGGVGKSTTAINLSAAMAARGHKILVIDMDPQGNTTSGLGIDKNSLESSIYEVLIGEDSAKESVITTKFDGLAVIPASTSLAGAEIELIDLDDREGKLVNAIGEIKDEYERRERKTRRYSSSSGKASWHDLPYRLERWQSDESVEKDIKKLIKECVWKTLRELCTK